jgi:hypothetical protein
MGTAKGNIIYTVFLCIVIPIILFFMIFPIVTASQKVVNYSEDYNKAMSMNDYKFKMSDAVYITDTKQFVFVFSVVAESNAEEAAKPYISDFISYDEKGKNTDFPDGYEYADRSNISQYVYVSNVESGFRYVEIYATSTIPSYQEPSTQDEFGDEIPGEIHEEETTTQYCRVDKADVKLMTAEEAVAYLVAKTDESEALTLETDSESDETQSYIDVQITSAVVNSQPDLSSSDSDSSTTQLQESADSLTSASSVSDSQTSDSNPSNATDSLTNNGGNGGNGGGGNSGGGGSGNGGNDNNAQPVETTVATTTTTTATTTAKPTTTTKRTTTTTPQTTTTRRTTTTTTAPQTVSVNRIYLETDFENNNVTLNINDKTQFKAVVEPANASDKSVKWTSNKPEIAEVDSNGKVTAKSKGKAIITAETVDGGLKASCMVTVN